MNYNRQVIFLDTKQISQAILFGHVVENDVQIYSVVFRKNSQSEEPYRRDDFVIKRNLDGAFFKSNVLVSTGSNYEAMPWGQVFYNEETGEYE